MDVTKQYGLQIRKLKHGGYLVLHPDMYELGALFFASTTIDEAFAFIRSVLDREPELPAHDREHGAAHEASAPRVHR